MTFLDSASGRIPFVITTKSSIVDVSDFVLGTPQIDLTIGQVSELVLTIADKDFMMLRTGVVAELNTVAYADLLFEIAAIETTGGTSEPRLIVTCRPAAVQRMRRDTGHLIESGMSPTEWIKRRADEQNVGFVGQTTASRPSITRVGPSSTDTEGESSWDVALRLAGEEGFLFFESANVFYFGQPTWLIGLASNAPATPASLSGATTVEGAYPAGAGYPAVATRAAWGPDFDVNIAATILMVATDLGASPRATLAALEAAIVESRCQNVDFGDTAGPDSRGVFQQRNPWGTAAQRLNPAEATRLFFQGGSGAGTYGAMHYDSTGIKSGRQLVTAGDIAQATQVSAFASRYDAVIDQARDLQAAALQVMPQDYAARAPQTTLIPEVQALVNAAPRVPSPPRPDIRVWVIAYPAGRPGEITPHAVPQARRSVDSPEEQSLEVVLEHTQARLVRPGDCILLKGIPTFDNTYLVTSVPFPLDNRSSVTVSAIRPRDPAPAPQDQPSAGEGAGDADPTLGTTGGQLQGSRLVGAPTSPKGLIWPVPGSTLISVYGASRGNRPHRGNDIGRVGGTGDPVYAVADGYVEEVGYQGRYGLVVKIKHNTPQAGQFMTVYSHNQTNFARVGQTVQQGDHIANMGTTGNAAGGTPHVHFEIRVAPFRYNEDTQDVRYNGWLP